MWKCEYCGSGNKEEAKFCEHCGAPLPAKPQQAPEPEPYKDPLEDPFKDDEIPEPEPQEEPIQNQTSYAQPKTPISVDKTKIIIFSVVVALFLSRIFGLIALFLGITIKEGMPIEEQEKKFNSAKTCCLIGLAIGIIQVLYIFIRM